MTELSLASLSLSEDSRCKTCHDLDAFHLEISASSLFESAGQGCESCSLLKEGITKFCESYASIRLLVDGTLFATLIAGDKKEIGVVEFYTHEGHPSSWQKIGPGRDVSTDSSSDKCISLAKRWLQGCLKAHTACARSSVPLLPTRVIDVGKTEADTRLYLPENERAEYVALSHCWGGATPLTTTIATLEDRKAGINFDHASQTFKDAADVTRKLGIHYLWIDSLCIVQDSKQDWEREAGHMSEVYNNATLTISVDAATRPEDGLYPKDRQLLNKSEPVKARGIGPAIESSDLSSNVYARFRHDDPFHINNTVHSSQPQEKTKLSTRGWVLQEELLSPRILHFRKEEMSWICSTYSRCECRIRPDLPIPHLFRGSPTTFAPSAEFTHRLHLEWPFVVANFTRRSLAFPSDRLPAMSGLAAWIEQRTMDTYFAGLWYEDLAFHLLWYSAADDDDNGTEVTRFDEPYAPSWSWASITGPISYLGRHTAFITSSQPEQPRQSITPLLTVVGVYNLPENADLNKYGPVKSAVIQLYARIIPVTYDVNANKWNTTTPIPHFDPASVRVTLDVPSEFTPASWPTDANDPARPKYCFVLAGQWSGGEMTVLRKQAVCLLVRRMTTERDHDRLFRNILLFATLLCEGDSYVRVGFVRGVGSVKGWEEKVERKIVHLL